MWTIGFADRLHFPASRASSESGEMLAFAHIPTGTTTNQGLDVDNSKSRTVAPASVLTALGADLKPRGATPSRRGSGCRTNRVHFISLGRSRPLGQSDGYGRVRVCQYIGPTRRPWRRCSNAWGSSLRHRSKNVTLYKQGDIILILNAQPESFAQAFERCGSLVIAALNSACGEPCRGRSVCRQCAAEFRPTRRAASPASLASLRRSMLLAFRTARRRLAYPDGAQPALSGAGLIF